MGRTTHTYALLEISESAYLEIKKKLEEVGYHHTFHENPSAPNHPRIDMSGIAVIPQLSTIGEPKEIKGRKR